MGVSLVLSPECHTLRVKALLRPLADVKPMHPSKVEALHRIYFHAELLTWLCDKTLNGKLDRADIIAAHNS